MLDSTRAYGLDFLFPAGDDTVGRMLKTYGEFARPEVDILIDYAAGERGTFIDVGANIGAICLPFAKAKAKWRVVAIEAHRGLCNVLAANALGNHLYGVEPLHAAVGDQSRLVDFPAVPLSQAGNYGTMSLAMERGAKEPVRMLRLDDVAPEDTRLVKIDVEGFEPQVLDGAPRLLAARRAVWLAEAADQHAEAARRTTATFLDAGYSVHWFFAPFATFKSPKARPDKPALGDSNVIALPPGIANRWSLPAVSSVDDPRPTDPQLYRYLYERYGY